MSVFFLKKMRSVLYMYMYVHDLHDISECREQNNK